MNITTIDAKNPFFSKYKTPHNTQPFDKIKVTDYEPAFDEAIQQNELEVKRIANNESDPTFENTIIAFENTGKLLDKVSSAFYTVLSANATDEMMAIAQKISPKMSEMSNNILLNKKLFARIKKVYDQRESLALSLEDKKLLDNTYKSFARSGANLSEDQKKTYRALTEKLSLLTLKFDQNSLKDKEAFSMLLTKEEEIAGLPESALEAALLKAKEEGKKGWLFDLSYPSYGPFLRYADNRALRQKMYMANMHVACKGNEYDNVEIVRSIVNTRLALANLLGYKTYADYVMQYTMAKTPANVFKLEDKLLKAYRPTASQEMSALQGFARGYEKKDLVLMPWDVAYYSHKLRELCFKVNDEMTRPYFELDHVRKNIFGLATKLYGLTFRENKDIPVYNKDVQTYEVFDKDGSFLAVLYTDLFPRKGKQSGAWMNSVKDEFVDEAGKSSRPHVILVTNFTPPTETKPSLLTFSEVQTMLHEFGHCLHGMLANTKYASMSGTSVYRDFVELPSQIMENFITEKAFLDKLAVHYQTGEKIPEQWINNLIAARNFNVGYACLRQLSFGYLDMAWHSITTPYKGDIKAFEDQAMMRTALLPPVEGAMMSTAFGHIFAGGYAAGYYGYKWAEVLDADAFEAFKEANLFDSKVSTSFRKNILSKGGTEDPAVLYKRFRGKEPTIKALLKRNGIKNIED